METGRFSIAWWNTRMSPPKGSRLEGDERAFALKTIHAMLAKGVDILGLCEVNDDDINDIILPVISDFAVHRFVVTDVGRKFHMCLILRRNSVVVHSVTALTKTEGRRNFRIAITASCKIADLPFELYLVHWPSRLYAIQEGFERGFFGYALREDIDQKIGAGRGNVIVVGDFNDEPYNTSMTERILATRDPVVARRKPDLLYNPFWKRMAPTVGHLPDTHGLESFGSYHYKSHSLVKWHALDQLLVTGPFLGSLPWHLSETETDVWRPPELLEHVTSAKSLIDHLPLIGTFVRY